MFDRPTKSLTYTFPLDSVRLYDNKTGGNLDVNILQLTRWLCYSRIDYSWWRFKGPITNPSQRPEDEHWRWGKIVRNLRKNAWVRCAALQTADSHIQGAIAYRRDGASFLEGDTPAVYVEYVAAAPWNRYGHAKERSYLGVGEALMFLAVVHSYDWGYGGRVTLRSLPRAVNFYKNYYFVETGARDGRMICMELEPEAAQDHLKDMGFIQ